MQAMMKRWLTSGISLSAILAAAYRKWRVAQPAKSRAPQAIGALPPSPTPPTLHFDTFFGTVVRHGQRFALLEANGVLYALDSVGRAWSFEGEEVWVRGQLDFEAGVLHVKEIESQAA